MVIVLGVLLKKGKKKGKVERGITSRQRFPLSLLNSRPMVACKVGLVCGF